MEVVVNRVVAVIKPNSKFGLTAMTTNAAPKEPRTLTPQNMRNGAWELVPPYLSQNLVSCRWNMEHGSMGAGSTLLVAESGELSLVTHDQIQTERRD